MLGHDPGGGGSKPTRAVFRALVTSATTVLGGASDTVKTTIALEITSVVLVGEIVAGSRF